MFVNLNVIPAAIIGVILFYLGKLLARRITRPGARAIMVMVCVAGCLPSVLFLAYYFHLFGEPLWYIEWRSWPYTEVLSSLCAPLFGFICGQKSCFFLVAKGLFRFPIAAICALLIFVPFAKPVLLPVSRAAHWSDQWQDGVCLQSTPSTCGPAALATLLAHNGIKRTEREIARESYSCGSGTELWYLMRYARRQGLQVNIRHETDLTHVTVPAILGTRVSTYGHFIVLLDNAQRRFTIGDPLTGRAILAADRFDSQYRFDGCVLEIQK